jgi:pyrroline-5-carboxylate reductase
MTVVTTVPHEATLDRDIILAIFSSIGRCRFLDEKHFDACTALSASGPAFVCLVLEAMADGGVMMGLPRPEALELAAQGMTHRSSLISLFMADDYSSPPRNGAYGTPIRCSPSSDQRLSN